MQTQSIRRKKMLTFYLGYVKKIRQQSLIYCTLLLIKREVRRYNKTVITI